MLPKSVIEFRTRHVSGPVFAGTSRRGLDLACIGNIFWCLPTILIGRGIVGIFMSTRSSFTDSFLGFQYWHVVVMDYGNPFLLGHVIKFPFGVEWHVLYLEWWVLGDRPIFYMVKELFAIHFWIIKPVIRPLQVSPIKKNKAKKILSPFLHTFISILRNYPFCS